METTETKLVRRTKKGTLTKVSATQINTSKEPEGFTFEGTFLSLTPHESVDSETGETKTRFQCVIEKDNGDRFKFLADAGFRTALADAMITKGDWFKAVKGPKISLGGARTMNQWDIFQYTDNN